MALFNFSEKQKKALKQDPVEYIQMLKSLMSGEAKEPKFELYIPRTKK